MKIEGEQELESSVLRVPRWCVMAQRGGNTDVGIRCPLRPVPIPSTAITYNNDGLVEPVGDLTSAGKREKEGRYRGVGRTLYICVYGPRERARERERERRVNGISFTLPHPVSYFSTVPRKSRAKDKKNSRENENSANPVLEILFLWRKKYYIMNISLY